MRGKHQRLIRALVGGQLFAFGEHGLVGFVRHVILLDLRCGRVEHIPQKLGPKTSGEGGLADAGGAGEENGLMDPLGVNHSAEGLRDVGVAMEVVEHQMIW